MNCLMHGIADQIGFPGFIKIPRVHSCRLTQAVSRIYHLKPTLVLMPEFDTRMIGMSNRGQLLDVARDEWACFH